MRLKEDTKLFNAFIALDRFLNFCSGGSWQECFSTRAYKQARIAKKARVRKWWARVERVVDAIFWKGHCRDSLVWDIKVKDRYILKNRRLL
jgi:hypothetical protein